MSTHRRYLLLAIAVLGLICAAGVFLYVNRPSTLAQKFEQIEIRMSEEEVEAILGPSAESCVLPCDLFRKWDKWTDKGKDYWICYEKHLVGEELTATTVSDKWTQGNRRTWRDIVRDILGL